MKDIVVKLLLIFACLSLAACSTNTRQENTTVGAVSGGVVGGVIGGVAGGGAIGIGAGIVVGALIGGVIGHSMDSADHSHINHAMHKHTNRTTHWTNRKTGASYTITPTSDKMSLNGNNVCRTYTATATMNGKTRHDNGTACLQANGTWQTVKT